MLLIIIVSPACNEQDETQSIGNGVSWLVDDALPSKTTRRKGGSEIYQRHHAAEGSDGTDDEGKGTASLGVLGASLPGKLARRSNPR